MHPTLQIKAAIQILKPQAQVFQAITDPAHMAHYFIASSTGPMETGAHLIWRFPEFDADCPVRVIEVTPHTTIAYDWDNEDRVTRVTITLSQGKAPDTTLVRITEGTMPHDDAGMKWVQGNTEGWANFLACLKAYTEHGINLRKGAFDYPRP